MAKETTVERVRRHWKGKADTANAALEAQIDLRRREEDRAARYAESRDEWKAKADESRYYEETRYRELQTRLQKAERQRDELERINRDYERDLQHDTEMLQESQKRIWDTTESIGHALRIIDKLTERGKS